MMIALIVFGCIFVLELAALIFLMFTISLILIDWDSTPTSRQSIERLVRTVKQHNGRG